MDGARTTRIRRQSPCTPLRYRGGIGRRDASHDGKLPRIAVLLETHDLAVAENPDVRELGIKRLSGRFDRRAVAPFGYHSLTTPDDASYVDSEPVEILWGAGDDALERVTKPPKPDPLRRSSVKRYGRRAASRCVVGSRRTALADSAINTTASHGSDRLVPT